jgi:hypothetical protein
VTRSRHKRISPCSISRNDKLNNIKPNTRNYLIDAVYQYASAITTETFASCATEFSPLFSTQSSYSHFKCKHSKMCKAFDKNKALLIRYVDIQKYCGNVSSANSDV